MGVCMHAGQGAPPTRMLLPRSRYDEGVEFLAALFASVTVGDPQLPETLCGPVITGQRNRIVGYIRTGGRGGRHRWSAAANRLPDDRRGLLRAPDAVRRRRQLDDDRPRGDLRAGAGRHPLRR